VNWMNDLPFRIGTTSYILPDDILPNVKYLAGKVHDVELVLYEVDEAQNNLPTQEVVAELGRLSEHHDLTYTVHLPLDLRLGETGEGQHASIVKARRVIERTRALSPGAYITHLDGREARGEASDLALKAWRDQAAHALEVVAEAAGAARLLAVENLEGYPLEFWEPVLELSAVSRCVDVGHLWLDGSDPLPYLEQALPRTSVVHLHGIDQRDHASVAYVSPEPLDQVFGSLLKHNFGGVVTLEVFGESDLHSSLAAVKESLQRINAAGA
jgi:sugar phosphate isomerase/epimerase